VSASASVKAAKRNDWRTALARRAPAVVAVVLVLLGVIAVAYASMHLLTEQSSRSIGPMASSSTYRGPSTVPDCRPAMS
jgi:protein-S-isoprenylcysteine O-methyltransferase Ste14